jgi:transcriptional regulator with XRE-family HTH domain
MVTPYGKELRKIRIDKSIVLGDMAKDLGLSPAYLSSIENGKREIPKDFNSRLVSVYGLSENQKTVLEKTVVVVQKNLNINLEPVIGNPEYTETALMFARNFSRMMPEQVKQIKELFMTIEKEDPCGRT